MGVGFHERVLHRFIGIGCVAQVVPCDTGRATLLTSDDLREQLARGGVIPCGSQILHRARETCFGLGLTDRSGPGHVVYGCAGSHLIALTHEYDTPRCLFTGDCGGYAH